MEVKEMIGLELLSPKPDVCQECAVKHNPDEPHNKMSLFYQMKFQQKNGRSPTWEDAMSHCSKGMKKAWKEELLKCGLK